MTHWIRIGIGAVCCLLLSVSLAWSGGNTTPSSAPLDIAVVAPLTGAGGANGADMVDSIHLAVDELNRAGGIADRPLALKIFDDAANPARAREIAAEIAKDPEILAVLGHWDSSTSLAARDIYTAAGLPAITASATSNHLTENDSTMFQATFSNATQASIIVQYALFALGIPSAIVINSEETFGKTLSDSILLAAQDIGLKVSHHYHFPGQNGERQRDAIINAIKADKEARLVIVASLPEYAADIVAGLNYPGSKLRIIGPNTTTNPVFLNTLKATPMEGLMPGYHSDGVLMVSSLIPELAPPSSLPFRVAFASRYGREPSYTADAYYDATRLVAGALACALPGESRSAVDVKEVRRKLLGSCLRSSGETAPRDGVLGPLVFDDHRSFSRLPPIGQFTNQRISATPFLFTPIRDIDSVPDFSDKVKRGQIVQINNAFEWLTPVVFVAVTLNGIHNIDMINNTFDADLALSFRYSGAFDPKDIEFTNADGPVNLGQPIMERRQGAANIRAYRFNARFRADFDLADYPFDTQVLKITFRHKYLGEDQLRLVPDFLNMRLAGGLQLKDRLIERKIADDLRDWGLVSADIFGHTILTRTSFDTSSYLNRHDAISSSSITMSLQVARNRAAFMVKNAIYLVLISLIILSIYFITPDNVGPRLGAAITCCLTTAIVQGKLDSSLPSIATLVAIEYAFYIIYLLVYLSILITLIANLHQNDKPYNKRLRALGSGAHCTVCLVTVGCYYYLYYV